jgi:hypothetical protein
VLALESGLLRWVGRRRQTLAWNGSTDRNLASRFFRWSMDHPAGADVIHCCIFRNSSRGRI